jgi:hypothetical protein
MPITQSYFLDAPSLGSATSVFLDNGLSVCAPDGFYSDGVITRQQVSCKLLPQESCPSCASPCGEDVIFADFGSVVPQLYSIPISTGNDAGAIVIRFNPFTVPDGIRAEFGGVTYNKLVSPLYGVLQSSNPLGYTVIGNLANAGCLSFSPYVDVPEKEWDGAAFVDSGNTEDITLSAGDVQLTSLSPESCVMVIPKPTAGQAIVNLSIFAPCPSIFSQFEISIECPVMLTPYTRSVAGSGVGVCELDRNQVYYYVPMTPGLGPISVNDLVFSDPYGQTPLPNGDYQVAGSSDAITVVNGVVDSLFTCAPAGPGG